MFRRELGALHVDRAVVGPQVEADRHRPVKLAADGGQQMLAAVLLHVVKPALPVHRTVHGRIVRQALHFMQHLVIFADHVKHRDPLDRSFIVRLPAPMGVKGAFLEDDIIPVRALQRPADARLPFGKISRFEIQSFCHRSFPFPCPSTLTIQFFPPAVKERCASPHFPFSSFIYCYE